MYEIVTCLQHQSTQVTVEDLFCKMPYLYIVQWQFAFTLCHSPASQTVCYNFKNWIHSVVWLGKTDEAYEEQIKAIANVLTYWTA